MNTLGKKNGETVNIRDLAETDIFQMLMARDSIRKKDFLALCDKARRALERQEAA